MRKYINGHRYDTETAKLLGSDSYSNPSDFDHWSEELYRTNAGLYFLHGEGGPASKYAKTIGQNEWSGGEDISQLSEQAARAWAEEHLDADKVDAIWQPVAEDVVGITVQLPASVIAAIDARKEAEPTMRSRSDVVAAALREYLR